MEEERLLLSPSKVDEQLEATYKALEKQGDAPYAESVLATDLKPDQKLTLMSLKQEYKKRVQMGQASRHLGMCLGVVEAMMAAVVPIMIATSSQFKGQHIGQFEDFGLVLSFAAIGCSLLGTLCMIFEKTRRFKGVSSHDLTECYLQHSERMLFLALSGPYKGLGDSHQSAFPAFIERYALIRNEAYKQINAIYAGEPIHTKDEEKSSGAAATVSA